MVETQAGLPAVLLSIRPEWCKKILAGEKNFEIRKSAPQLPGPFQCYIYCTQQKSGEAPLLVQVGDGQSYVGNGFVIASFVCDEVRKLSAPCSDADAEGSCLTAEQLDAYASGSPIRAWHIQALTVFEKPLPLSSLVGLTKNKFGYAPRKMTSPPQSWRYVRNLKGM